MCLCQSWLKEHEGCGVPNDGYNTKWGYPYYNLFVDGNESACRTVAEALKTKLQVIVGCYHGGGKGSTKYYLHVLSPAVAEPRSAESVCKIPLAKINAAIAKHLPTTTTTTTRTTRTSRTKTVTTMATIAPTTAMQRTSRKRTTTTVLAIAPTTAMQPPAAPAAAADDDDSNGKRNHAAAVALPIVVVGLLLAGVGIAWKRRAAQQTGAAARAERRRHLDGPGVLKMVENPLRRPTAAALAGTFGAADGSTVGNGAGAGEVYYSTISDAADAGAGAGGGAAVRTGAAAAEYSTLDEQGAAVYQPAAAAGMYAEPSSSAVMYEAAPKGARVRYANQAAVHAQQGGGGALYSVPTEDEVGGVMYASSA